MTTTKKPTERGRPLNCWMKEEDMALIRQLATYISSEGHRVSDSQVIKAAIRVAQPDKKLLRAFEEVIAQDGRLKKS